MILISIINEINSKLNNMFSGLKNRSSDSQKYNQIHVTGVFRREQAGGENGKTIMSASISYTLYY